MSFWEAATVFIMFIFLAMICFGFWNAEDASTIRKAVTSGQLTHNWKLYVVRPAKVVAGDWTDASSENIDAHGVVVWETEGT